MRNILNECIVAQTKKKKISLKQLAERLNSPIDEVKDIVDGKRVPTIPQFFQLYHFLDLGKENLQEKLVSQIQSAAEVMVNYDRVRLAHMIYTNFRL